MITRLFVARIGDNAMFPNFIFILAFGLHNAIYVNSTGRLSKA